MKKELLITYCDTPLGTMCIEGYGSTLHRLQFVKQEMASQHDNTLLQTHSFISSTLSWLEAYFSAGTLPMLPPLYLMGTPFQRKVWEMALALPWGHTTSYGSMAEQVAQFMGRERPAPRAVGRALGANPILLMIPCHRVLAQGNRVGGFTAGVDRKEWLLRHEQVQCLSQAITSKGELLMNEERMSLAISRVNLQLDEASGGRFGINV